MHTQIYLDNPTNHEIRTSMLTLDVVKCSWSNSQKEFLLTVHSLVTYTANWSLPYMEE